MRRSAVGGGGPRPSSWRDTRLRRGGGCAPDTAGAEAATGHEGPWGAVRKRANVAPAGARSVGTGSRPLMRLIWLLYRSRKMRLGSACTGMHMQARGRVSARARAEEGRARAEEGRARAEEGRARAEEGRARAEEGRARAEEGRAGAEEGRAGAEEGRAGAEEAQLVRLGGACRLLICEIWLFW